MQEQFEKLAREALKDVYRHVRCYEAARLIARNLRFHRFKVRVQDGFLAYHLSSVVAGTVFEDMEFDSEYVVYSHSWCEVTVDEQVFYIDWQNLSIVGPGGIDNLLIVHEKGSMLHQHYHLGFRLWRWVVFPLILYPFHPHAIRLQIPRVAV